MVRSYSRIEIVCRTSLRARFLKLEMELIAEPHTYSRSRSYCKVLTPSWTNMYHRQEIIPRINRTLPVPASSTCGLNLSGGHRRPGLIPVLRQRHLVTSNPVARGGHNSVTSRSVKSPNGGSGAVTRSRGREFYINNT